MKVVLLTNIRKKGKVGQVIEMKNGYARNFLIPNGIVKKATKENLAYFRERESQIQKMDLERQSASEKDKQKLSDNVVTIIRNASEKKRLYGKVRPVDISNEVRTQYGVEVDKNNVTMLSRIEELGIYFAEILLHAEVVLKMKINVARSKDEAREQLKQEEIDRLEKQKEEEEEKAKKEQLRKEEKAKKAMEETEGDIKEEGAKEIEAADSNNTKTSTGEESSGDKDLKEQK